MSRELNEQCAKAMGYSTLYADGGFGPSLYLHDTGAVRESESVTANAHLLGARWERLRVNGVVAEYYVRLCPAFSENHEAAGVLEDEIERRGLRGQYIGGLLSILLEETDYDIIDSDPDRNIRDAWYCIRATPEQRARAFLEAVQG